MSRAGRRRLYLLVGVAILVVVFATTGIDPAVAGLRSLDPLTLLAGAALTLPATAACAWRWRVVAARLGVTIDLAPAVAACYRAQFLNTVLPGGVAGDVHRGVVHGRAVDAVARALRAVLVERFAGQLVLAGAAVPVLLAAAPVGPTLPEPVVALGAVVSGAVVASVLRLLSGPGWPVVVLASVVALVCNLALYLLAARAVGVEEAWSTLLPVVMLVFLAAALPTNVAGWGPREGMAVWGFTAVGLGAEQGLATAVAFGALVLVANLPGALILAVGHRRPGARAVGAPVEEPAGSTAHG